MQRILRAKEFSKFEISNNFVNVHVGIGPLTEIRVFESIGTWVTKVLVLPRQPGNLKSWMRISRGIEQHARQFIHKDTEQQNSGAVLSTQSSSCGPPRAQTQGEQSPTKYKAAPLPKSMSLGFSQRIWKIIPAKAKHKREL